MESKTGMGGDAVAFSSPSAQEAARAEDAQPRFQPRCVVAGGGGGHVSLPEGARLYELPNGMEIVYQSKAEVPFFYEDIFQKEVYLKHGVRLNDGDCVFDVGANIGMFTLFAHRKCPNVTIYAFEPAPPLFEILCLNASLHGVRAKLFNCGLSDRSKTATFTFYPHSSGMSSFYGDKDEEKSALKSVINNQLRRGVSGIDKVWEHVEDLLEQRFESQTYTCQLFTLSDLIAAQGVGRIDLLKIDVQKSELDVVSGLRPADWHKVRQVVLEVHDIGGRLNQINELLVEQGFDVVAEQDELYEGSLLYNVYAVRHGQAGAHSFAGRKALEPSSLQKIRERADRQNATRRRQQKHPGKKGKND